MSIIKHKEQRVGIFIDAQNLYHSGKNLYHSKVNFGAIVKDALDGRKLVRAVAYVIATESGEETGFFEALATLPEETYEAAEALAALRVLAVLGLDAGEIPGTASVFTPTVLAPVQKARTDYIARINHGIAASGL